jgi:hypothetical protein
MEELTFELVDEAEVVHSKGRKDTTKKISAEVAQMAEFENFKLFADLLLSFLAHF